MSDYVPVAQRMCPCCKKPARRRRWGSYLVVQLRKNAPATEPVCFDCAHRLKCEDWEITEQAESRKAFQNNEMWSIEQMVRHGYILGPGQ